MNDTTTDPFELVEIGDDDPIGAFDEDNICGEVAVTYLGHNRQMTCLREPHPAGWMHVSCCDDRVEFAWRDLTDAEQHMGVMTPDGFVCRDCAIELTSERENHFGGCPQLVRS